MNLKKCLRNKAGTIPLDAVVTVNRPLPRLIGAREIAAVSSIAIASVSNAAHRLRSGSDHRQPASRWARLQNAAA
jgi:hypothetical protein